jgi:hypothetical protein
VVNARLAPVRASQSGKCRDEVSANFSSGAAVAGPGLALVAIDRSSLAVAIA